LARKGEPKKKRTRVSSAYPDPRLTKKASRSGREKKIQRVAISRPSKKPKKLKPGGRYSTLPVQQKGKIKKNSIKTGAGKKG